ncbi:MAG: alanine-tRNA synthetase second additional domain-containing protein [Pirellulales bacterium]|nr:alanine-tRNA synthetase second additional domain-containing protein [Pirellulales bacterium]
MYAAYYAPRGRLRLYMVASELAHRYLYPTDLVVGIIGAEGSGKSTLIKGLFPGLELTNDDDGVNLQPTPIYHFSPDNYFAPHTFHVDVRYESAFKQRFEIVEAITKAVSHGRRVVIEHFDLIYDALGYNAQILFGIGEEIIVSRPNVFGPFPAAIKAVVDKTIKYRLMAHSAEDITAMVLERDYNYRMPIHHSDVKHGFVLNFPTKPEIDLNELEAKVREIVKQDLPIVSEGEEGILVGESAIPCTGPRTHVQRTGQIKNFRLVKKFSYHPISKEYMLIGIVGPREQAGYDQLSRDIDA